MIFEELSLEPIDPSVFTLPPAIETMVKAEKAAEESAAGKDDSKKEDTAE